MRRHDTDLSSIDLAGVVGVSQMRLMIGATQGAYPLPDYDSDGEHYWYASTIATYLGALGRPLGVDASVLIEGMHGLEEQARPGRLPVESEGGEHD